ncbi:adenine-specific methyltransferase EcoRI family protein [Hominicoprocola fusiformis]
MAGNSNLNSAKTARKDEFYTQLTDIEKEMRYYRKHFQGKTVLCNCDDPFESNFFKYFALNFNRLGLKKLIATCYYSSPITGQQLQYGCDANGQMTFYFEDKGVEENKSKRPYKAVVTQVYDKKGDGGVDMLDVAELFRSGENELVELEGDGDFRSPECLALLDEADIIVTNPPFSLFREYVSMLVEHQKHFIIIGNQNAISYEETFSLMKNNKMWIGASIHSGDRAFFVPDDYPLDAAGCGIDEITGRKYIRVKGIRWFTNLDIKQRHEEMILVRHYTPEQYPKYVNYDAIEVAKTSDIPCDYDGEMGVPITFMDKYNPEQFEIIGISRELVRTLSEDVRKNGAYPQIGRFYLDVGAEKYKKVYERLVIRNKRPELPKEEK